MNDNNQGAVHTGRDAQVAHDMAKMRDTGFDSIVIVGLGLVGGSIAMALRQLPNPPQVTALDSDEQSLQHALEAGWIDCGVRSSEGALADVLREGGHDLVILAMPVRYAPEMLQQIEESGYAGTITDTASTKASICRIAQTVLSDPMRFIPGHPMAGSEVNGLRGASPAMFTGKYWILCPDQHTDSERFAGLHALVTALGAKCISIDRGAHDQLVAIVSHIPHLVASALVELALRHAADDPALFRLAAGGFKDSTRVAAGSSTLWTDIIMDNRAAIAAGLREFRAIIDDFEQAVEAGDSATLGALLVRSASTRRKIPKNWLPNSEELAIMRVPMHNQAGAVAMVTGLAGRFGCNIQSLSIDHITEDTAMLEMILTDEGNIAQLTSELESMGFDVTLDTLAGEGAEEPL